MNFTPYVISQQHTIMGVHITYFLLLMKLIIYAQLSKVMLVKENLLWVLLKRRKRWGVNLLIMQELRFAARNLSRKYYYLRLHLCIINPTILLIWRQW